MLSLSVSLAVAIDLFFLLNRPVALSPHDEQLGKTAVREARLVRRA